MTSMSSDATAPSGLGHERGAGGHRATNGGGTAGEGQEECAATVDEAEAFNLRTASVERVSRGACAVSRVAPVCVFPEFQLKIAKSLIAGQTDHHDVDGLYDLLCPQNRHVVPAMMQTYTNDVLCGRSLLLCQIPTRSEIFPDRATTPSISSPSTERTRRSSSCTWFGLTGTQISPPMILS